MGSDIFFKDLLIMAISLMLVVLSLAGSFCWGAVPFEGVFIIYPGLFLFFYSSIKTIAGIIIFIQNALHNNIAAFSYKILILFIPMLILFIYIIFIFYMWDLWDKEFVILLILFIFGCSPLLCYFLLNNTMDIKIQYKIIMAILHPISYFIGYLTAWLKYYGYLG